METTDLFNIQTLSSNTETILSKVFSKSHLIKVFQLLKKKKKKTLISNLTYSGLCAVFLLFWEAKLQIDDENERSFYFCATWSVVFVLTNIKITAEKIWSYYIVSQNFNWDNRVRCQNMKNLTFLTYYLFVKIPPKSCLRIFSETALFNSTKEHIQETYQGTSRSGSWSGTT